jgi:hypothetical protein
MTQVTNCLPGSGNDPLPPVPASRREVLHQAVVEAMFYADPPQDCPACEAQDQLCQTCATGWTRARAYLALGRDLGIQNIYEVTPDTKELTTPN